MAEWISVRQQAGSYIKECRYVRPWHRAVESPGERADKNRIINQTKTTFRRKPKERAELFVGLLGLDATFYTLTFDDDHLPRNYADARRIWKNFMNRLKKAKGRIIDYIFCVETVHGDGRWHFHVIFRDADITKSEVFKIWGNGTQNDAEPSICQDWPPHRRGEYMTKDRKTPDGIPLDKVPWGVSKGLRAQLPPPEKTTVDNGVIRIPEDAVQMNRFEISNQFGAYTYAAYMVTRTRTPARGRDNNLGNNALLREIT